MSADVFAPLRATIARAEHCLTEHSANVYVGAVFELVEAKALLDRLLREHAEMTAHLMACTATRPTPNMGESSSTLGPSSSPHPTDNQT